jgi:hypothetical protein
MAVKRPKGKRNPTPKAIGRWDDEGGAPSGGRSRAKRPRDPNQLAKSIVEIATGQREDREPTPEEQGKDPAAAALGRRGGKARAGKLSPEKRAEIARKAAESRWKK